MLYREMRLNCTHLTRRNTQQCAQLIKAIMKDRSDGKFWLALAEETVYEENRVKKNNIGTILKPDILVQFTRTQKIMLDHCTI